MDFHRAFAAAHGVEARADEVAVEKNVSRRGEEIDASQSGLKQLRVAADGVEVELSRALRADERAVHRAHHDVAGNFLEMNVARDALKRHVAHDLLNVDEAGLRLELEFGLFGN